MDRQRTHGIIGSCSMQAPECSALQLLLQERAGQGVGVATDASRRRALYGTAFFRFAQNHSAIEKRGSQGQPQAHPKDYAATGPKQQSARTQYFKTAPGAYQVPLSAQWRRFISTSGGLEHRHHVYPATKWLRIPGCSDRLVQPPRTIPSALQQPRGKLLPRCLRGGDRTLWTAQNLQYRSRGAIYLKGVRAGGSRSKYSLQHGWTGTSFRQRVCRTAMEIGQV